MQTTTSAMISDLSAVLNQKTSKFIGFYDTIDALTDASGTPSDGLQAIVLSPSEFYYHAIGGSWVKFAPVGEVHPGYVGSYDNVQDLQSARPSPSDGDLAIIGKSHFYIFDAGSWDQLITPGSGSETAQVTKNAADITAIKAKVRDFDTNPPGVDKSGLDGNEIGKWDETQNKWVGTGLYSNEDGELDVAPSSISFGNHLMSSSVANVIFHNKYTHRNYSFVYQEVAPGLDAGYVRAYSSSIEKVVRVPVGDIDVVNPVNEGVTIDANELFIGGEIILSQGATNVVLEISNHSDKKRIWRQILGDLNAGRNIITFKVPIDMRANHTYDAKVYSFDGDVTLKSNASFGFSWTINRVTWEDKEIATKEWNAQQLTPLSDDIETLKSKLTAMGVKVQALQNQGGKLSQVGKVFNYRGGNPIPYPDDVRTAYFVSMEQATGSRITVYLPKPAEELPAGTLFMLVNENYQTAVNIDASHDGYAINHGNSLNVPPNNQFCLLIKTSDGWETVAHGFIPSSLPSISAQVRTQITKDLQSNTAIRDAVESDFNSFFAKKMLDKRTLSKLAASLGPLLPKKPPKDQPANLVENEMMQSGYVAIGKGDAPSSKIVVDKQYLDGQNMEIDGLTDSAESKVWIAVPQGRKVIGIKLDQGVPAIWESKTVDGFTFYQSPYAFNVSPIFFSVAWG